MVAPQARGKGLATSMCNHSQDIAKKLCFEIVGKLPKAFNHPTKGYIEALVMYKWL